jgi:hypothetical protein
MGGRTDLEWAADKHKYKLLSGEFAPSVTSITGMLDGGKSMGMAHAAAKLGPDFKTIWDEKADRGTRIHAHCQAWLEGQSVDAKDDEQPYLDALQLFFDQRRPSPIEVERIVLSSLGYGGRFDFICELAGEVWIVDLKTGKPYALEHAMQLSAYAHADGMAVYSEGTLERLEPLPTVTRGACLYVHDDGTYDLIEYPIKYRTFKCFEHLLSLHKSLPDVRRAIKETE